MHSMAAFLTLFFVILKTNFYVLCNTHFSFLLNNFFVAASKPKGKRNKTGFILYTSNSPPLNSSAKIEFYICFYFRFVTDN